MHDTPTPGTSDGKFHGRQYNTNSNISNIFNPTLSQNSGLRVIYIYMIYVCSILVLVSSHDLRSRTFCNKWALILVNMSRCTRDL